jgi:uncharacterized protein (TIGR02453 family)
MLQILDFLTTLKDNNNREWFAEHKAEYEQAKANFETFIEKLIPQMTSLDEKFAHLKAKDTTFRIYRDVRFSKEKSPFKINFSSYFCKGGKSSELAGYYLHIEPANHNFFAGGGAYMPPADLLKKIRQEIDYNAETFSEIVKHGDFKTAFGELQGEKLKTVPKGYSAENLSIEFLKMKGFFVMHPFSKEDVLSKHFDKQVVDIFSKMKPLIDFLNEAMEN